MLDASEEAIECARQELRDHLLGALLWWHNAFKDCEHEARVLAELGRLWDSCKNTPAELLRQFAEAIAIDDYFTLAAAEGLYSDIGFGRVFGDASEYIRAALTNAENIRGARRPWETAGCFMPQSKALN
jgi:hypothetical protein